MQKKLLAVAVAGALVAPAAFAQTSETGAITGKVTQGPAKIDLKTFRVEVRDGKAFVELIK